MKRFHFRLGMVLTLRRKEEDQARRLYAEAAEKRRHQEGVLHRLEAVYSRQCEDMRQKCLGLVQAADLDRRRAYLIRLEYEIEGEQATLQRLVKGEEAAREALRLAAQKRRVLEKLEERQRASHHQAVQHQEAKFLDFIVSTRQREEV